MSNYSVKLNKLHMFYIHQFSMDLCEALIASNIPLDKIKNPAFKQFLQKYCLNQNIPDESTFGNHVWECK